jgi:hypothetical protein
MNKEPVMDFSRTTALLLLAICLATNPALAKEVKESETDGVKLVLGSSSTPKTLGEMVPFAIQFVAPLRQGEKLTVFADSGHLAYLVTPKEGFLLREFRGRVRMNDGALKISVERGSGKKVEITQSITIDQRYSIPKSGKATKEFRVRGKGNRIEIIHANSMALENYVKQMDVAVSGGGLTISMTPYSSGMAYYLIEGDSTLDGAHIDIQLADTPYQLAE